MTLPTLPTPLSHEDRQYATHDLVGITPDHDGYHAKVVLVTPELARGWLKSNNIDNRSVRASAVEDYAAMIASGAWRQDGNTVAFDWNGRLINGQHRLMALVRADQGVTMLVALNCDPLGFATTDAGRNRNGRDVLSITDPDGKYHGELSSLARFIVQHERGSRRRSVSNEDTLRLFEEIGPEMVAACEMASSVYPFVRGSRLALAASYFFIRQADPAAALEFFASWPKGLGFVEGDPRAALTRAWNNANKGTSAVDRTAWVIKGYNAWVRGEQRQIVVWKSRQEQFPQPVSRLQFGQELRAVEQAAAEAEAV